MHGTREQILDFIVGHRGARVEDLTAELGITAAAVRRHLDNLRADGLVDVRSVKQHTGRPYYAYLATEQAAGSLPPSYADLLARLFESFDGEEGVGALVSAKAAESLAQRHREEAGAADGDRVQRVTASLREEGILETWHAAEDGIHLVNGSCPYRRAAEISWLPCESDRQAIALLLGQEVRQVQRIVDGASCCEYVVQPATIPVESVDVTSRAS